MYGDSNMPISPTNTNPKDEQMQIPLMESHDYSSQNNSGLLRFRSAPTSLLSNFTTGAEKSSARFCSTPDDDEENSVHVIMDIIDDNSCNKVTSGNNNRLSAMMNSQLPPQYPRRQSGGELGSNLSDGGGGRFSLLRQNSSPAGLLSHLTAQTGYTGVRSGVLGSYRTADINVANRDLISPSSTRLRMSSSSLGLLSRITEVETEHSGPHTPNYTKVGNSSGDNLVSSTSGFPFGCWNDSSYFAETFTTSGGIKTEVDNDPKPIFISENEEIIRTRPSYNLSQYHLSLPKSTASSEMSKLLHLQDSVPCKIRAKRGCATHPRSIAERVRRTRISERMRKLQDLVPNMDKQTNTADMLDLAVEYIKTLQKQYKILGDDRANCKCLASSKVILNQTR